MDDPEVLILFSGGVDSTACVHFYSQLRRSLCSLFVDYGQPAAKNELKSAKTIANYYSIPLMLSEWRGPQNKTDGFINGRNSFLLAAALMECPSTVSVITLGIHAGTNYADCSKYFLDKMQNLIDVYGSHKIQVAAPFIDFTKSEIYSYCIKESVPIELTYSCERGGPRPCRECLSCKDREILNART